jgi:surface antigen
MGMDPVRSRKRLFALLTRGFAVLCATAGIAVALPAGAQAASLRFEPSATLFWTVNGPSLLSLFQNGQCTQWAAEKRPDVVKAIVVSTIAHDLQQGLGEMIPNFDARYWTSLAQGAGIATGQTPKVGALMVFQPGVMGAGSAGHIAYVQSVRKRTFTISEMHAPLLFHVTYETLRRYEARQRGVRFIY